MRRYAVRRNRVIRGQLVAMVGDVVYEQLQPDYGLASDDERAADQSYVTVTKNADGSPPGFMVPLRDLTPDPPLRPDAEFRRLVLLMRDAQRAYFADRTPANLKRAKDLEQKVDRALSAQPDLAFGS